MFVQFPHSGYEHKLTKVERKTTLNGHMLKYWNCGSHKRKFMKAKGKYLDSKGVLSESDLYFWGEWEPTSYATEIDPNADGHKLPKYLQEPVLILNKNGKPNPKWCLKSKAKNAKNSCQKIHCTNTDPYVFYDNFLYSCCRQINNGNITCMQHLSMGSIILFGSAFDTNTPDAKFWVDTVFVVGESKEYDPERACTDLNAFVPSDYYTIMGFNMAGWPPKYVCYHGVSYDEKPHGPFSFVPCKTSLLSNDGTTKGFERPIIRLSDLNGIVNPKSFRGINCHELTSKTEADDLWNDIKDLVERQGFELGVKFWKTIIKY